MNPQDYRRAVECFSQIEALDSSARASRLAEIRAQDPELADSVEAMWNASNAKGTLLDTPPAECRELRALLHLGVDTNVPDRIGEFRVLHRLAVGGMAEVYLAQQQRPLRLVAIKVLRPLFALGEARAQFDREIELLGRLNHTGIVGVVLAGECDLGEGSQPYLVMEYVDGVPINDFVRVGKSTLAARVALVADAAEAVASAHAAGVLHLDLKPANVLVDRHGRVRVLDFGVGRLLHDPRRAGSSSTSHTGVTLQYASPEQRKGQLDRVGPASDLYSLSLLTLEVVTDRPPSALFHDELAGFDAALTQIMNQSSLGEEVAAILRPALELDPRRRLDSASDLSHRLRQALTAASGEHPRQESAATSPRGSVWISRKRLVLAGVGVLLVAAIATALSWLSQRQASLAAIDPRTLLTAAQGALNTGRVDQARAYAARMEQKSSSWDRRFLNQLLDSPAWSIPAWSDHPTSAVWSRDGEFVAISSATYEIEILSTADGSRARLLDGHICAVNDLASSPEGQFIASASCDGSLRIWTWTAPNPIATIGLPEPAYSIAWHPSRTAILTATRDGAVRYVDLEIADDGTPTGGAPRDDLVSSRLPFTHRHARSRLRIIGDGSVAALACGYHPIRFIDLNDGAVTESSHAPLAETKMLVPLSSSTKLHYLDSDGGVGTLDAGGTELGRSIEAGPSVTAIAAPEDGRSLWLGFTDGRVEHRWLDGSRSFLHQVEFPVYMLAASPDGNSAIVLPKRRHALLLRDSDAPIRIVRPSGAWMNALEFAADDGALFAGAGEFPLEDGGVHRIDLANLDTSRAYDGTDAISSCRYDRPGGRLLALEGSDLLRIDPARVQATTRQSLGSYQARVDLTSDGLFAVSISASQVSIVNLAERTVQFAACPPDFEGRDVRCVPGSHRAIVLSMQGDYVPLDIDTAMFGPVVSPITHAHPAPLASALALSPNGDRAYIGRQTGELYAIDLKSGRSLWSNVTLPRGVHGICAFDNGRRLALIGYECDTLVVDTADGSPVLDLPRLVGDTLEIASSDDGRWLAVSGTTGRIAIFNAGTDPAPAATTAPP